jgi:flagellar biosynthesis component FlhA
MVAAEYASNVRGDRAAMVCSSQVRAGISEFLRRFGIRLDVYAYGELPPDMELKPAMIVGAA